MQETGGDASLNLTKSKAKNEQLTEEIDNLNQMIQELQSEMQKKDEYLKIEKQRLIDVRTELKD